MKITPALARALEQVEAEAWSDLYHAAMSEDVRANGINMATIDSASAMGAGRIDVLALNRVVGLETAEPAQLHALQQLDQTSSGPRIAARGRHRPAGRAHRTRARRCLCPAGGPRIRVAENGGALAGAARGAPGLAALRGVRRERGRRRSSDVHDGRQRLSLSGCHQSRPPPTRRAERAHRAAHP